MKPDTTGWIVLTGGRIARLTRIADPNDQQVGTWMRGWRLSRHCADAAPSQPAPPDRTM